LFSSGIFGKFSNISRTYIFYFNRQSFHSDLIRSLWLLISINEYLYPVEVPISSVWPAAPAAASPALARD
jgi:hypothetical protein